MTRVALIFLFILTSCSTMGRKRPQRIKGQYGVYYWLITCDDVKDCHHQAQNLCDDHYNTKSSSWNPKTADRGSTDHEIIVECKDQKKLYR